MILYNIFIIITIFIVFKFLFFIVVLILKVKCLNKHDKDKELASICKTTYLDFTNINEECYIIPTITIIKDNTGIILEFKWFNIYYANSWRIITSEEETVYINASINKNK